MARTRQFDPSEALDKALALFWRQGYYGTSIEDLVGVTGVSRYGLYSVFGSKQGLFMAALDRYQKNMIGGLLHKFEQSDAALDAIHGFFAALTEAATAPGNRLGCLICNTASELAPHDADAAQAVEAFRQRLSGDFRRVLKNARDKGMLAAGFDIDREADFLTGIVQALSVLSRSGADRKSIEHLLDVALSTLG